MDTRRDLVDQLSPDMRREVQDFVEFLLERRGKRARGEPELGWAGALRGMAANWSSVDLQHRIAKWRTGEE